MGYSYLQFLHQRKWHMRKKRDREDPKSLFIKFNRKARSLFPKEVLSRLSEIFSGLGNLMVGSIILPYALGRGDISTLIKGSLVAIFFWLISLLFAYKSHE